ncbi:MAG: ATP-binding protein [Deltaproteobacteria bacterium]|nr:ATP-binding protein [Deltaproteobacteria bacterium]
MRELSLHILDIAENGITAGADCLQILVNEARNEDLLTIVIEDNGRGMPADKLESPADPFITTRTTRRVGLGLSLLEAAARRCDGKLEIETEAGRGTRVLATFGYNHIDRAPMGDMAATITTLIMGNPQIDFVYTHIIDTKDFVLDTRELKAGPEDHSLTDPVLIHHLTQSIRKSLDRLALGNGKSEVTEENHGKIDD